MFTVTDATFDPTLQVENRVSNDVFTEQYIRYFDNDGFELSYLEQEYYRENNVSINTLLNHTCDQTEWIRCDNSLFKLDHSLLLHRRSFVGEAREQLIKYKSQFPQLDKYIRLTPKWGLDFALEYYHGKTSLEVIHFENDYPSYEQALEVKLKLEEKILITDWIHFVQKLIWYKDKWETLPGMQQNDWKAEFWGLNRAEETIKSFK